MTNSRIPAGNGTAFQFLSHRRAKPQAPENRNSKNQAPNTKEIPSSKLQTATRASSLELGAWSFSGVWSLVFGVWDLVLLWGLEFGIWSLLPGSWRAVEF